MAGSYKLEGQEVQTFLNGLVSSSRRYRRNIDAIVAKYERPFANDDRIDLSTLSISRDCGRLIKNPPVEMGKAVLKSTKHKEELSLKQMQEQHEQNPNVSMAITRKCVSILETSKLLNEEDVSDAETIGSELSDNWEEVDDEDRCSESEDGDDEDSEQVEGISGKEEEEMDGKTDRKLFSPYKDGGDKEIGKKRRNQTKEGQISSDVKYDNFQKVLRSKEFQDDFEELTNKFKFGKSAITSANRNDGDSQRRMVQTTTLSSKSTPFKRSSNDDFPMQRSNHMDQIIQNEANIKHNVDNSFTNPRSNMSFVDNIRSKADKHRAGFTNEANCTTETFNLSAFGRVLDISSILNDSFDSPAVADLSFVSISSPREQVHDKSKTPAMQKQNCKEGTFVVEVSPVDTRQASHVIKYLNDPEEAQGQSGLSVLDRYKSKTKTKISCLKIDVKSSETSATQTDKHEAGLSMQSVLNCPALVSEEVFKSPHGIKIRRVRPKQLTSNVSDVSHDSGLASKINTGMPSYSSKDLKENFLPSQSWEKCESIISSISSLSRGNEQQPSRSFGNVGIKNWSDNDSNAGRLKGISQHMGLKLDGCQNKKSMIPTDMTFTSTDESERPWSKACELAMRSPTKQGNCSRSYNLGKNSFNVVRTSPKKQNEQLRLTPRKSPRNSQQASANISPSKSSKLNVSLTSSFKNMDLYPSQSPVKKDKLTSSDLQHTLAVTPQQDSYKVCQKVHRFEGDKIDRTFTQLTPSLPNTLANHPTFLPDSTEREVRDTCTETRLKAAGFDPLKWSSKETLQSRGQGTCSMKRKIPASFTSGYCSQASPSLLEVKQNLGLLGLRHDSENKVTSSTANYPLPSKYCQQIEKSCVCAPCFNDKQTLTSPSTGCTPRRTSFKHVHSNTTFTPVKSSRSFERGTGPMQVQSFENKKVRSKRSLQQQTPPEKASVNPFLLSPSDQQDRLSSQPVSPLPNRTQVFYNMDNSHVLKWLQDSRKHYNSREIFGSVYSPSKLSFTYKNKATTTKSQKMKTGALSSEFPTLHSSSVANSNEKRDVGVQVSLETSHAPQCCLSHQTHCHCCSSHHVSYHPVTSMPHSCHSPIKSAFTYQASSSPHHTHQGRIQSCFGESPGQTSQNSYSEGQDSLKRRAMAVWRQIQAEKSVEESFLSDVSIIESETSPSASTFLDEEPIIEGDNDENDFADDEEVVDETVDEREPRRHSTLLDDLNKMFEGKLENTSFVESQRARIKSSTGHKNPTYSSVTVSEKAQQVSQNIMFPMSYINEFSPNNPARRDSDMAMYEYEQQRLASAPSLKTTLKSFKPRRNQHQAPKHMKINTVAPARTTPVSPVEDTTMERPMKYSKITQMSPSHVKTKSAVGVDHHFLSAPIYKNNPGFSMAAVRDSFQNQDSDTDKVSTPLKKILPNITPKLGLEETISTIISPTVGMKNSERATTPELSIISEDYSCSDPDSDDEINLL